MRRRTWPWSEVPNLPGCGMKTPGQAPAARPWAPKGTPFYLLKCAICFGVALMANLKITMDNLDLQYHQPSNTHVFPWCASREPGFGRKTATGRWFYLTNQIHCQTFFAEFKNCNCMFAIFLCIWLPLNRSLRPHFSKFSPTRGQVGFIWVYGTHRTRKTGLFGRNFTQVDFPLVSKFTAEETARWSSSHASHENQQLA